MHLKVPGVHVEFYLKVYFMVDYQAHHGVTGLLSGVTVHKHQ